MGPSRSEDLFNRSQGLIPGGVNSPVRAFRSVGGTPRFMVRGSGSRVWDEDGNEYIDYLGSWGPLALGHAHPTVVEAVKAAAEKGTSFGAPTAGEVELAQLVCDAFESIERVRLVNSGTEACMSALRLARAFTGRDKIIKFAGCYHGHADGLLVKAGSGALDLGIPTSAGVPESYAQQTLVAEYNDLASVERFFDGYPDQIAAIIVEPVAGNMGVVLPMEGFLEGLRGACSDNGALLIFDEVITGFRIAYGGAQELYGVHADITCLGKIIGGGLPVGAYGGRADVMDMAAPLGPMYQAGTLSGNPIAVAAGMATLTALKQPGVYDQLESKAARLADGFAEGARESGAAVSVNRIGSMMTSFFNPGPVNGLADAEASDTKTYAAFFHGMLEKGVYLAPSQFEAGFVSTAHTGEDIDSTIEAATATLREISL